MLAARSDVEANLNMFSMIHMIYRNEGINKLFAGIVPRTLWITIGGFIYLGTLEKVKNLLS